MEKTTSQPPLSGWNALPGELRNMIYDHALMSWVKEPGHQNLTRMLKNYVKEPGLVKVVDFSNSAAHLRNTSKKIQQEVSEILHDHGHYRVNGYTWRRDIPSGFDFSKVKSFEIILSEMEHVDSSNMRDLDENMRMLTALLIQAEALQHLTIRFAPGMTHCGPLCFDKRKWVSVLTPWAKALQDKLNKAKIERQRLGENVTNTEKSALDHLRLIPETEGSGWVKVSRLEAWLLILKQALDCRLWFDGF